jgi:hypothetical protein
MTEYAEQGEGFRVVMAGNSSYKIVCDRATNLWTIEVAAGPLPVALRGKSYTGHKHALKDIKNYLAGHAQRSIVYKKPKVSASEGE